MGDPHPPFLIPSFFSDLAGLGPRVPESQAFSDFREVNLQSRQETSAAVDYKKRARALNAGCSFMEQPIPDQEAGGDFP